MAVDKEGVWVVCKVRSEGCLQQIKEKVSGALQETLDISKGLQQCLPELALIILLVSGCAWDTNSWVRHGIYSGLHLLDWKQTQTIARNPDRYWEMNPVLGRHPSVQRVNTYFLATYLVNTAISVLLTDELRKWFQFGIIGVEGVAVGWNLNNGIKP